MESERERTRVYPHQLPKGAWHGMSRAQYIFRLKDQDHKCALCREPPAEGRVLQWDHDHAHCPGPKGCKQCVRGLVCGRCNTRIAVVENSLRFDVQPVLDYLEKWAGRQPELPSFPETNPLAP